MQEAEYIDIDSGMPLEGAVRIDGVIAPPKIGEVARLSYDKDDLLTECDFEVLEIHTSETFGDANPHSNSSTVKVFKEFRGQVRNLSTPN